MKNKSEVFTALSKIRFLLRQNNNLAAVTVADELVLKGDLPDFVKRYLEYVIKRYQFRHIQETSRPRRTSIEKIAKITDQKSNGVKGEPTKLRTYARMTPFVNALYEKGIFITNIRVNNDNRVVINAFTLKKFSDLSVRILSGADELKQQLILHSNGGTDEKWIRMTLQCTEISLGLSLELSFFSQTSNDREKILVNTGSLNSYREVATQCNDILLPPYLSSYSANQLLRLGENEVARKEHYINSENGIKDKEFYIIRLATKGYNISQLIEINKETFGSFLDYKFFAESIKNLKSNSRILFLEDELIPREDLNEYIAYNEQVEETIRSGKAMLFNHLIKSTLKGEVFSSNFQSAVHANIGFERGKIFSCKALVVDAKSLLNIFFDSRISSINDIFSIIDAIEAEGLIVVNDLFMAGICFHSPLPREQERCIRQDLSQYLHKSIGKKKSIILDSRQLSVSAILDQNDETKARIMETHYKNISLKCISLDQPRLTNPFKTASLDKAPSPIHSRNLLIQPAILCKLIYDNESNFTYFSSQDYQELGVNFFYSLCSLLENINNSFSVSALTLIRKSTADDFSSTLLGYCCSIERDIYPRLGKYIIPYSLAPKLSQIQVAPFYGTLYRTDFLKECLRSFSGPCSIVDFQIALSIAANQSKLLQLTTNASVIAYTNKNDIMLSDRASPRLANQLLQSTVMATTPVIRTHFKPKYD